MFLGSRTYASDFVLEDLTSVFAGSLSWQALNSVVADVRFGHAPKGFLRGWMSAALPACALVGSPGIWFQLLAGIASETKSRKIRQTGKDSESV